VGTIRGKRLKKQGRLFLLFRRPRSLRARHRDKQHNYEGDVWTIEKKVRGAMNPEIMRLQKGGKGRERPPRRKKILPRFVQTNFR